MAKTTAPLLGKVFIVIKRVRTSRGIWKNPEKKSRRDRLDKGSRLSMARAFCLREKTIAKKNGEAKKSSKIEQS